MTGALALDRVSITLGARTLIRDLSLAVAPGQIATLVGPSGSGKSSLLAYVTGTMPSALTASGRIFVDGEEMTHRPTERRRIGILFQDDLLFPHLTVGANLAFGLRPDFSRRERQTRIATALKDAELDGFENHDPLTLSGGQRARVSLLRTLLAEPRALLLDEPFSKLDRGLRDRFRAFVFDHVRTSMLPTVMVSHDLADAEAASGPIIDIAATDASE